MTRPIFFLTDFGLADTYVGVVKAVILGIAPDARIVDLTHDVPPQDVRAGAFALLTAAPHLPEDAVVLAVVDPGVGTARRPIAVQVAGRTFVGPDNGLLSWAVRPDFTPGMSPVPSRCAARTSAQPTCSPVREGGALTDAASDGPTGLPVSSRERDVGATQRSGGKINAVVLDRPRYWRPAISATFHGRDLFGPISAHLARGVPLNEVGSPCDAIQTLPFPPVHRTHDADSQLDAAHGEVVHVDRYGNLISNLSATDLPSDPVVEIAGRTIVGLSSHFQPPGSSEEGERVIALIGSVGLLEIAVPNGSAAALLGVGVGTAVSIAGRP